MPSSVQDPGDVRAYFEHCVACGDPVDIARALADQVAPPQSKDLGKEAGERDGALREGRIGPPALEHWLASQMSEIPKPPALDRSGSLSDKLYQPGE